MHPIERLRYVARASHVAPDVLARETAMALADFVGDDAGMLIACRRILDRQPTSAPLVWLAAHALAAPDQRVALWDAVDALEADQSEASLAYLLPDDSTVAVVGWSEVVASLARRRGDLNLVVIDVDGNADYAIDRYFGDVERLSTVEPQGTAQALFDADVVLLTLRALGAEQALAPLGSFAAAAVARHLGVPVWALAGVGVALPERMYQGLIGRWHLHTSEPPVAREVEEVPVGLIDQIITVAGGVPPAQAVRIGGCPIVPELH